MSPRSLDEGTREFSFPRVSGDEPLIHWPTRTPIYVFPA